MSVKSIFLALSGLMLSACVDLGSSDWNGGRTAGQSSLSGAESGSRYAVTLMGSDIKQISQTAWRVIETQSGSRQLRWTGSYSGSKGSVTAGPNYLVGFNSGEEIEAPISLDTRPYLSPTAGAFITHSNSNIRLSPTLQGRKVITLEKGVELRAIGRTEANNWYLVASRGKVLGYIFGELITRIKGGELLLAGGEPLQPKLCRELTYSMTLTTGEKDAWVNGACREAGSNWRIVGGRTLEVAAF